MTQHTLPLPSRLDGAKLALRSLDVMPRSEARKYL